MDGEKAVQQLRERNGRMKPEFLQIWVKPGTRRLSKETIRRKEQRHECR